MADQPPIGVSADRHCPRVLVVLPVLTAAVACLAFTNTVALAAAGSLVWGAAMGIQESTLRAMVADLVPSGRRATASSPASSAPPASRVVR
ncbi:MFS transporter [Streptomyces sp. 5-6(2022)]|uniref:MFS transporter n=1 Tax=Streptomyces sp. 5-6(2022) TaxID=2936510 RepID=UPI0023B8C183|nr:MFS transporter [Streptomyces sp. 5-6(2022)]